MNEKGKKKPEKFMDMLPRWIVGRDTDGNIIIGREVPEGIRDSDRLVAGVHRRTSHFFETYERTICVDIRSRRTIFRYAGRTSKRNNSSWWERLLVELRICKLKAIEI